MAAYTTLCASFQDTAHRFVDEPALRGAEVELTWGEYREHVERLARGLAGLGVGRGDTVGLMLVNRPEFHLLDTAALHVGATPFSVYNTSSAQQIRHVFANAGNRVVVTESAFLERVLEARTPELEHVLVLEQLDALEPLAGFDFEAAWRAVQPDDIATLIYTSGTTGPPKGAMLSHANLDATRRIAAAATPVMERRGRYVSYLPAAHLADRLFSHYPALANGSLITCVDDPRAAVGRLAEIRPTVWLAVPRIWEKLKDAIEAGVPVEQFALDSAELLVSGAAPIRRDVLEFFAGLGIAICEGYGMTESCGVATLNLAGELGTVGRALPGVELRLAGDGEVLLRGPNVMVGYRGELQRTAEAVDADGWLHTGDIGALDADGRLRIVDRKKELIINAAGKNMSPANIEAALKAASPLIAHAVAIGDGRPYNTALIVLDRDMVNGQDGVPARIAAAVAQANATLSRVEQIKKWTVVSDDWAPGGEELTPTLKLKRKPIAAKYAAAIGGMYA